MTDILYSMIFFIPFALVTASEIVHYIGDMPEGMALIPMLILSVLLAILVNVSNKIRTVIVASLGALILGVAVFVDNEAVNNWLKDNGWIWAAVIVIVAVSILDILMIKIRSVKIGVAAALLGVLISSYWTDLIREKISVVSIIFLSVTILIEEIRHHKRGVNHMATYVVRTVPFLLIGMLGLYYIPHSDKPYDWAFVKNIYNNISDDISAFIQLLDKHDSAGDMMSTLGFSEEAGISGNLTGKTEEIMRVSIGANASKYLYLDGKYFENFNGKEWTEAKDSYSCMMDLIEISSTLSLVDQKKLSDFRKIEEINVQYLKQNTKYVFAPSKSYASDINVSDTTIDYSGNEILFNKRRGLNTEYKVRYLQINRKDNIIQELLEAAERTDRNVWEAACFKLNLDEETYSYQNFLKYREMLYNNSLCTDAVSKNQLPATVAEFLAKTTAGATTDFDKLIALEKAFTDYEYTITPGEMPEETDTPYEFLDYFINYSQKGYCNSFATAFVLLCQAEGIPARYVHGYLVPREREATPVYNTMAHAYAEAYVKGIGWMVFDPTPGFLVGISWDEKGDFDYSTIPNRPDFEYHEEPEPEEIQTPEKKQIRWYMIATPAALIILVLITFILTERIINRKRFEKLSKEEKAYTKCLWIMKTLKYMGFTKSDHETINEYAARVAINLETFPRVLDKILYSTLPIEDHEYNELNREYEQILDKLEGREKMIAKVLGFFGGVS